MLTIQSLRFLFILKEVQGAENDLLYIDGDAMTVSRVSKNGESVPVASLSDYDGSYLSVIRYLKQNGLLVVPKRRSEQELYCRVTHSGFHLRQWRAFKVSAFLVRSVLVPIVVSFITALLVSLAAL